MKILYIILFIMNTNKINKNITIVQMVILIKVLFVSQHCF